MELRKRRVVELSVVAFVLAAAGCQAEATVTPAGPLGPAGLANPASVYCQGLGFREETRTEEAGEHGVCIFADNSECDTWDFLSGRCGQEHSYCAQQGGVLEEREDANIGTCHFDDGSSCGEYELFSGDCLPGE